MRIVKTLKWPDRLRQGRTSIVCGMRTRAQRCRGIAGVSARSGHTDCRVGIGTVLPNRVSRRSIDRICALWSGHCIHSTDHTPHKGHKLAVRVGETLHNKLGPSWVFDRPSHNATQCIVSCLLRNRIGTRTVRRFARSRDRSQFLGRSGPHACSPARDSTQRSPMPGGHDG